MNQMMNHTKMIESCQSSSPYLNNADEIFPLNLDPQSSTFVAQVQDVVHKMVTPLYHQKTTSTSNPNTLTVKPLTGGLSNELFIVSCISAQPTVLVRIHPSSPTTNDDDDDNDTHGHSHNNASIIVDREIENRLAAWLSSVHQAPLFYGRFTNGRIEEFYEQVTPLSHVEMPQYATDIAYNLSKFHHLDVPSSILPKPKLDSQTTTTSSTSSLSSSQSPIPSRFLAINKWVERIQEDNTNNSIRTMAQTIATEWEWLAKNLLVDNNIDDDDDNHQVSIDDTQKGRMFLRSLVFTHMDCQSLNILKLPFMEDQVITNTTDNHDIEKERKDNNMKNGNKKATIKFIDFEYAGWNPRAADIANTFCEFCDMNNLKGDYAKEYPSTQCQNSFLLSYLRQYDEWKDVVSATHLPMEEDATSAALSSSSSSPSSFDSSLISTLKAMRHEIGRFTLLSHLGWAAWSLVMAQEGTVDFDYVAYAQHRMDGYWFHKKEFF